MMENETTYEPVVMHPHWRQFLIDELPAMAAAAVLLIVGGLDGVRYHSVFFCIALDLLFKVYYRFVYLRGMVYTITGEQLVYEHGVFTRSRDYIELYRVVDYDESRSFLQLLLGLKTIVVHSGDRTMPRLRIIGIREGTDVVGCLRERVTYNRKRMHIHEFANYQ